jgi:hypothetical protein
MNSQHKAETTAKTRQADAEPDVSAPDGMPNVDPTDQEIEDWATNERERRRAWLDGPSQAERAAWAQRERERRLSELGPEARARQLAMIGMRYGRETQLAAEGAVNVLLGWSRKTFAELTQAGLEWEEESARSPRRRRIKLDDEEG